MENKVSDEVDNAALEAMPKISYFITTAGSPEPNRGKKNMVELRIFLPEEIFDVLKALDRFEAFSIVIHHEKTCYQFFKTAI